MRRAGDHLRPTKGIVLLHEKVRGTTQTRARGLDSIQKRAKLRSLAETPFVETRVMNYSAYVIPVVGTWYLRCPRGGAAGRSLYLKLFPLEDGLQANSRTLSLYGPQYQLYGVNFSLDM